VDALLLEAQNQAEMKRGLEEELKAAVLPYKQIEREISSVVKSQNAARNQIRKAQTNLEEARAQIMAMADSAESEEARCTAMLKQAEEELVDARSKVDALKQEQTNWLRSYEEIEPHVRHITSKVESQKRQIQGVQNTLRSLQSSNGQDMFALLGSRVATVANLVCTRLVVDAMAAVRVSYLSHIKTHRNNNLNFFPSFLIRYKDLKTSENFKVMSSVRLDSTLKLPRGWMNLQQQRNFRSDTIP
jgi:uncharacterized phage infection (PIP) family protein YhgE